MQPNRSGLSTHTGDHSSALEVVKVMPIVLNNKITKEKHYKWGVMGQKVTSIM